MIESKEMRVEDIRQNSISASNGGRSVEGNYVELHLVFQQNDQND